MSGETLSGLASRYHLRMQAIARANQLPAPYRLYAGEYLKIPLPEENLAPPASRPAVAAPVVVAAISPPLLPAPAIRVVPVDAPSAAASRDVQLASLGDEPVSAPPLPHDRLEATRRAATRDPPALSGEGFLWPIHGRIASAFGAKPNGTRNDGVNIAAPEGTPVLAAENGIVVFAGDEIPGYGQMLLISHADGYLTAYAHNRELLAKVGDHVTRGQAVAAVGHTGDVGTPQLHFELRRGKQAVDPLVVLAPPSTQMASAS